jgi:hypothetical protein
MERGWRRSTSVKVRRRNSSAELLAPGLQLGSQSFQYSLDGHRNARLVVHLGNCSCARLESVRDAPESDGVSHGGLDEVGQVFAMPEHGLELGAQLRFGQRSLAAMNRR